MTAIVDPVAGVATDVFAEAPPASSPTARSRRVIRLITSLGWAAVGLGALVGVWALVASRVEDLPTPAATFSTLRDLLADPFYDNGPNDKGIGLQLLSSLQRVGIGFAVAAIVGVPLGLVIGASRRAWKAVNPVIQLLRPVSPLAWFPIWLVILKDAPTAAIWVIFITALWPIVINTAAGAASVPEDQRNVARVFRFGRWQYVRHVLVPHSLPSVVTGLRLSMGVAWMVIVAVEMLSGGVGIGFFVWDAYNALNLSKVIAAIILIGAVGVVLDLLFLRLARAVAIEEVSP
jgi:nitrate/nitrite transport system permease protein